MSQFYYDGQVRRFLLQFARIFSNFEVEFGLNNVGEQTMIRVPVRYGDASRQAQTILQENSANNVPCAPQMSFYVNNLKYDRKRVQEPSFVDRKQVRQREWNEGSQSYEQTQGNAFNVERPMPVPYELGLSLDIWTSSTNMKLQLIEQILPLFNPALEIQSTDNYLDWTSLSAVELADVNWSSRSIPNNNNDIDIATLKFTLPIWLSPPAKVTKDGVIHKIIASIYDSDGQYVDAINSDDLLLGTRIKITPHGYQVFLLGNELRLLPPTAPEDNLDNLELPDVVDSNLSWNAVSGEYGVLNDGISQVRLISDEGNDIVGTVTRHSVDQSVLIFNVDEDTISSNTIPPIDAIIDPLVSGPSAGLPAAVAGQRYLITEDIGDADNVAEAEAWKGNNPNFKAKKHDIVEFNGTDWVVVFNAEDFDKGHGNNEGLDPDNPVVVREYVTNLTTGVQYKTKEKGWVRSYEGIYHGGDWGLIL
jgi:hypothetical protein